MNKGKEDLQMWCILIKCSAINEIASCSKSGTRCTRVRKELIFIHGLF